MGFASYPPNGQRYTGASVSDEKAKSTLTKSFLYMFLAFLVSCAVALGMGYAFSRFIFPNYASGQMDVNSSAFIAYIAIMVSCFIILLIDEIWMNMRMVSGAKSIAPHFAVYAILMGIFLSSFLVLGVDFAIIGEALGISAALFLILFLIGYFSKANLSIGAFIGIAIVGALGLLGLLALVLFLLVPGALQTYNLIFMGVYSVVFLIVVCADIQNCKAMIERGSANPNVSLYCAYVMYSDFIVLFIRVLWIFIQLKGNSRK